MAEPTAEDRERARHLRAFIAQRIAELPGRTSPEDWPEAMLVTHDELADVIDEALATTLAEERERTLERAAKVVCRGCDREGSPHRSPYRRPPYAPDDWWHENAIRCGAGDVWDLISAPRTT